MRNVTSNIDAIIIKGSRHMNNFTRYSESNALLNHVRFARCVVETRVPMMSRNKSHKMLNIFCVLKIILVVQPIVSSSGIIGLLKVWSPDVAALFHAEGGSHGFHMAWIGLVGQAILHNANHPVQNFDLFEILGLNPQSAAELNIKEIFQRSLILI